MIKACVAVIIHRHNNEPIQSRLAVPVLDIAKLRIYLNIFSFDGLHITKHTVVTTPVLK